MEKMLLALLLWLAAAPSPAEILDAAIAKRDAQNGKQFTDREDRKPWEALKQTNFETYDLIMLEGEDSRSPSYIPAFPEEQKLSNTRRTLWLAENLVFRYNRKAMTVVRIQGEARHRFYNYKLFQSDNKLIPE